jgi:hypothetical protein
VFFKQQLQSVKLGACLRIVMALRRLASLLLLLLQQPLLMLHGCSRGRHLDRHMHARGRFDVVRSLEGVELQEPRIAGCTDLLVAAVSTHTHTQTHTSGSKNQKRNAAAVERRGRRLGYTAFSRAKSEVQY